MMKMNAKRIIGGEVMRKNLKKVVDIFGEL